MKGTSESAPGGHNRLRRIEGRHNVLLKQLRQAFAHAERTDQGDCAIEGTHLVEEAIRSGLRFRAVFFRESAQGRAARLLPQIGAHVETLLLPDKLFDGAVPSETPQGVAALVRLKEFSIDDVLERVQVGPIVVVAGRFYARPRRWAAGARCWAKVRSVCSTRKSFERRLDRRFGCRS